MNDFISSILIILLILLTLGSVFVVFNLIIHLLKGYGLIMGSGGDQSGLLAIVNSELSEPRRTTLGRRLSLLTAIIFLAVLIFGLVSFLRSVFPGYLDNFGY